MEINYGQRVYKKGEGCLIRQGYGFYYKNKFYMGNFIDFFCRIIIIKRHIGQVIYNIIEYLVKNNLLFKPLRKKIYMLWLKRFNKKKYNFFCQEALRKILRAEWRNR